MAKILLNIAIINYKQYIPPFKQIIAEIDSGSELSYISSSLAQRLLINNIHWDNTFGEIKGIFSTLRPIGDGTIFFMFKSPRYTKVFKTPIFILPPKTIAPNEVILGRDFLANNKFVIQYAPNHQEKMFEDEHDFPIEQMRLN